MSQEGRCNQVRHSYVAAAQTKFYKMTFDQYCVYIESTLIPNHIFDQYCVNADRIRPFMILIRIDQWFFREIFSWSILISYRSLPIELRRYLLNIDSRINGIINVGSHIDRWYLWSILIQAWLYIDAINRSAHFFETFDKYWINIDRCINNQHWSISFDGSKNLWVFALRSSLINGFHFVFKILHLCFDQYWLFLSTLIFYQYWSISIIDDSVVHRAMVVFTFTFHFIVSTLINIDQCWSILISSYRIFSFRFAVLRVGVRDSSGTLLSCLSPMQLCT